MSSKTYDVVINMSEPGSNNEEVRILNLLNLIFRKLGCSSDLMLRSFYRNSVRSLRSSCLLLVEKTTRTRSFPFLTLARIF
jgi:hypothetical protein